LTVPRDDELTDGDAYLMIRTTPTAIRDTLAKLALIGCMVLCFAIILAWVGLWESTWRIAVEPARNAAYSAQIGRSPCLLRSFWWWRESGCRVI
jgi:hypothetical protein